MESLATALPWIQVALSVLLIIAILLQRAGAEVGGVLGSGGDGFGIAYTRRGGERMFFGVTIVLAVLFVLSALAASFLR